MKSIPPSLLLLCALMASCSEKPAASIAAAPEVKEAWQDVPDTSVAKTVLDYDKTTGTWSLNDQPYSGYMVSFHEGGELQEKTGLLHGRKQHLAVRWYPDGHLQQVANYRKGRLHGEKKRWSAAANHVLVAHLNYRLGKAHGEQQQWYPTGELYKKLHLNMGREEGLQQAFRKNGEVYANYEAKNGRTFGLKKAALCYGLEAENINYEK